MAVKFIIDSASDLLPEEARALGVEVLPLQVTFGEENFLDGVDLTYPEFYRKLTASQKLPTTSQISPAVYADAFDRVVAAGDEAVVITLSSRLSGTFQSACIAAREYAGKVFVVDSRNATVGQRALLLRGLEFAAEGMDASAVAAALMEERKNVRLVAVLDTLEYLKKGGRISAATAIAGTLLSVKPAVAVRDGAVVSAGTARGTKKAAQLLRQLVAECGTVDPKKPVQFVYTPGGEEALRYFRETYGEELGLDRNAPARMLGCAIGTHIGPGGYGVTFFVE